MSHLVINDICCYQQCSILTLTTLLLDTIKDETKKSKRIIKNLAGGRYSRSTRGTRILRNFYLDSTAERHSGELSRIFANGSGNRRVFLPRLFRHNLEAKREKRLRRKYLLIYSGNHRDVTSRLFNRYFVYSLFRRSGNCILYRCVIYIL